MRTAYGLLGIMTVIVLGVALFLASGTAEEESITESNDEYSMATLKLTSPAFAEGGTIPALYTCDGENIHPPLEISGVPDEAVALALIMDDPDAPDGTWDHWVRYNIPPDLTKIEERKEFSADNGVGSLGKEAYQGPCPPEGEHRYSFRLYALDRTIEIESEGVPTKAEVEEAMVGHILEKAELIGVYAR